MEAKQRGRPRSFDREAALEQATRLFWQHGYDATSVADLTGAMGIRAPSLYAAFGDKKALFDEVVDVYGQVHGSFADRALDEEPTIRGGVERMLREAAAEYTEPGRPRGCLVISAATNCTSADVERALRERRNANVRDIERRIQTAIDSGELPTGANARALALFTAVTLQGMSQQARDGTDRADLETVAAAAMRTWP